MPTPKRFTRTGILIIRWITSFGNDAQTLEHLHAAGANAKWYSRFGKQSSSYSSGPEILFLSIHLREAKTYVHTKTCLSVFGVTLLITDKSWRRPMCSAADEPHMVYPSSGILCSHRRNEVLEGEISESKKTIHCIILLI